MSGSDEAESPADALPAIRGDGSVLGFDVGSRRIGVALGTPLAGQARALAVVDVHAAGPDWAAVDRLYREWRPDGFIVGDPLTLDGGSQPARERAHGFARQLQSRYRRQVLLVDERSSSMEAAQRFARARAQGHKRRRDAVALDAMAAAVIVDRWMGAPGDAIDIRAVAPTGDDPSTASGTATTDPGKTA
ncbi:Holliday junction resolvase RuvX [Lysobacter ciconiae]|uniref:Putative pre-16S rRNA nuclease n=1 Tax=Novilysobacter ciconiae TaxID=2781022 RepID=A0A7S6UEV5_9GAMM|nr:Holliday junction resolvase RuvX [Lysobacter ciconiae]